ncbi:MAG: hypothetical protein ACTIMQ_13775 [Acinetobacter guillouiae]
MNIIEIYEKDITYFENQRNILNERISNIDSINYNFGDSVLALKQKNDDREAWIKDIEDLNKIIFDLKKKIFEANQSEIN